MKSPTGALNMDRPYLRNLIAGLATGGLAVLPAAAQDAGEAQAFCDATNQRVGDDYCRVDSAARTLTFEYPTVGSGLSLCRSVQWQLHLVGWAAKFVTE